MKTDFYLGKNFIVTGASSGIGKGVSEGLAAKGANIILIGRDKEKLDRVCSSLPENGKHTFLSYDLSNVDGIQDLMNSIYADYERIDGLAYCAGTNNKLRFKDLTFNQIIPIIKTNFFSFVEMVRCLSILKKRSDYLGVVGVSSLASNTNEKYMLSYSASKASMESAVRVLASELKPKNTFISSVRPGFVDTPMNYQMNELYGDIGKKIEMDGYQLYGLIPVHVVADMIINLIGPDARFFSGGNLVIPAGAAC